MERDVVAIPPVHKPGRGGTQLAVARGRAQIAGMPDPTIRPARPEDAGASARCIDAAYAAFRADIPDLPDVTGGLADDIAGNRVWVATIGLQVAGVLILSVAGDAAHLVNLAVDPDRQGTGLGRMLVTHAEAEARRSGCATIRLATHVRMPRNLRFYARLGWRETGRDGNRVLMSRSL